MEKLHGKLTVKRLFGLVNIGEGRPTGDLQAKTVTPSQSQIVVTPDAEYYGLSRVTVEGMNLQDKTVAPGTSAQIVEPDEGYTGLDSVTVEAAPLQQKSIVPAVGPQEVTPDAGFYGLEKVTVEATPLQEITITPGSEKLELTPDEDYIGFSKITVEAVEGGGSGGSGGGSGGDGGGTGGGDSGGDSGGGGDSSDLSPAEDETFGHETYPYMAYYAPDGGLIDYAPAPIGEYCAIRWVTNHLNGVAGGEVIAHYAELAVSPAPLIWGSYAFWPNVSSDDWLVSFYKCDILAGETGWTHLADAHNNIEDADWINHDSVDGGTKAGTYGPYVWIVDREETYTIEGETVNALVSAAQTVTGSPAPLKPDEATAALEEYAADKWEGGSY